MSQSFPFARHGSSDENEPSRFVVKVFDTVDEDPLDDADPSFEKTETTLTSSSRTRTQISSLVVRETGRVRQIQIQRVPQKPNAPRLEPLLTLRDEDAQTLIDYISLLKDVSPAGETSARIDDRLLEAAFSDPTAFKRAYVNHSEELRSLIENDISAADVIAIASRKATVAEFEKLLNDDAHFDSVKSELNCGPEGVWQKFLERNPWILGANLSGQLLTSWSDDKLEQTVTGKSITMPGKRTDGLLRTNGEIRSMVFAEIKHHRTDLLRGPDPYRSGSYSPTDELSGGVAQVQQTVYLAVQQIGAFLADKDPEGFRLSGRGTYLHRPRSFLIAGSLAEFKKEEAVHEDKYRCFELYRRNLYEPEVLTFDELLGRAQWQVALAEAESEAAGSPEDQQQTASGA
ncbi:Shedu immune nuclease family protein [Arthrobacter sp. 4R501]|uniref:Shedu immune nuclease family protein n=1 Tax=Arthrobacter sp. 4R501 TaxID=2058886 RepID=UPI001C674EEF|nr:Shedu immune nuclease family protein [Arthrobacter sp. 4R501]